MTLILCLDMYYFFFFFFKQKTAYEIRPRDWSSDVCSSDLEFGLMVLIILCHVLGRGRGDVAGLGAVEYNVVDRTLLGLVTIECVHPRLGQGHPAADGLRELAPQREAPLLGGETRFGVTGAADDLLEARAVELPVRPLEGRIVGDLARDLGVRDVETQLARLLVERGLRHKLSGELLVELERARLVRRDRAAQFAAQLLQAVVVDLTELVDGDLGRADLGHGRAAETAEDVADAPDGEAHRDQPENHGHDRPPEPIGGSRANTAKHRSPSEV